MSEQELYELSEPELRQMLANGERNVEREISRMYDKLAFTVVMLPFITSFIKKGVIRKLDAIEKMQISNEVRNGSGALANLGFSVQMVGNNY